MDRPALVRSERMKFGMDRPPLDARLGRYRFESHWWGMVPPQPLNLDRHTQLQLEVHYVFEGGGTFLTGETPVVVRRGSVCLALPEEPHGWSTPPGGRLGIFYVAYTVSFGPPGQDPDRTPASRDEASELVGQFLAGPRRVRRDNRTLKIGETFAEIQQELEERSAGWKAAAESHAATLLLKVCRLFAPAPLPSLDRFPDVEWLATTFDRRSRETDALFERASDLMVREYRRSLRVETVARELHVSVRQVQRVFERHGTTFREYLQRIRLEAARFLLMTTDRKVGDIGLDVGYADESYFSNAFLGTFGVRPFRYRELRKPPASPDAGGPRR